MDFANSLTQWYLNNKRDLPWRNTKDPYLIWLSEIMLQQTRVAQGMPYYHAFTKAFPTVFDLANASEQEVLKLWQGLGYYSRARNLHKTAQHIAQNLHGVFPSNFKDLLNLKGVGAYTAAAIASFSYEEAVPVVDGNVFRVLARYFDIQTDIQSNIAQKEFFELAYELMTKEKPALFNQAIMEFGALQCVPKNPDCNICPLNEGCLARYKKEVHLLPVKVKKLTIRNRYFNYLVFLDGDGNTIINKRSQKGIWQNLYEFPLIESPSIMEMKDFESQIRNQKFVDNSIASLEEVHSKSQLHKLTHQHLHIKFWRVTVHGSITNGINYTNLMTYPFPIVLHNFIEKDWF